MSHFEALCRLTIGDTSSDMIKWALRRWIDSLERHWNYDATCMHDMIDVSPRAAWLLFRASTLGQFRRDLPIEAWCAAGLTAVRHEDCGPCTQLGLTMAERAGVSADVLRAVLADDHRAMPPDAALAWRFTRATLAHDAGADDYREVIVERWGRRALVSLAFAITAARIYPTVKYALGHGKACARVVVGGTLVRFEHGRVPAPKEVAVRTT
jgi:hypothetical protein